MPNLPQHTKEKESGEPRQWSKPYSTRVKRDFFQEISESSTLNGTQIPETDILVKIKDIMVRYGGFNLVYRFNLVFQVSNEDPLVRLDKIKILEPKLKKKIRPYIAHYQKKIGENTSSKTPTFLIAFIIMSVFLSLFINNNNEVINSTKNDSFYVILGISFYAIISLIIVYISWFIYKLTRFSINLIIKHLLKENVVADIMYYFITIIWLAEGNEPRLTETENRKQQIILLEKIAKSIENDLPRILRGGDIATDAWVKETMMQVAAALREKKKSLLIPKKVTSNSFINSIVSTIDQIAEGNWGDVEKIEPAKLTRLELRQTILKFLVNLLKGTFIGAIPLIGFLLIQHTQFALQGAIFTSTVTILIIYEIAVFTSVLDPNFGDHVSKAQQIKNLLQLPGTSSNK